MSDNCYRLNSNLRNNRCVSLCFKIPSFSIACIPCGHLACTKEERREEKDLLYHHHPARKGRKGLGKEKQEMKWGLQFLCPVAQPSGAAWAKSSLLHFYLVPGGVKKSGNPSSFPGFQAIGIGKTLTSSTKQWKTGPSSSKLKQVEDFFATLTMISVCLAQITTRNFWEKPWPCDSKYPIDFTRVGFHPIKRALARFTGMLCLPHITLVTTSSCKLSSLLQQPPLPREESREPGARAVAASWGSKALPELCLPSPQPCPWGKCRKQHSSVITRKFTHVLGVSTASFQAVLQ